MASCSLIIEDDAESARELAAMLRLLGAAPIAAAGAQEGLRKFHDFLPDLVFLGLGRPGDDQGSARLAAHLKRTDHGLITPLVLMAGQPTVESRMDVIRSHAAVDCISRPFQVEKVRTLLSWLAHPREDESGTVEDPELERFRPSPESEGVVSLEGGSLPYLLGRA